MEPDPITRLARSRVSTRGEVYSRLRDALVDATLEPGRRLSENELAGLLGVSRTPVREALVRLRDDRLVEIVPQLGTFVSLISESALRDAQFIRVALECAAVRLAAERADASDVKALEGLLAHQAECRDRADHDRFYVLDDELHAALCELSGHGVSWSLAQRANGHLNRVRRLSLPQPRYLHEMVAEHGLIVKAVGRNDADAAEEALRHHLEMVLSALPAIRAEHPDFFEEENA
jgi:DNA-binding GntR family transcriptional regulator